MKDLAFKYLKVAGLMILYIIAYFLVNKLATYLYFNVWGKCNFAGKQLKDNIPLYHLFLDMFLLPTFMLIFAVFKRQNLFKTVNFGKVNWHITGAIAILMLFVSLFTASFTKMPWSETLFPNVSGLLDGRLLIQHPLQFVIWLPLHCAIWRELLFRGIIMNEFKSVMPASLAIIMQGLMQGLLFFLFLKLDLVFYGLLGGIIFGIVYLWCKSLWASIIGQIFLELFLKLWNETNYVIFTKTTAPIILGCSMFLILLALLYLKEYVETTTINDHTNVKATTNIAG